MKYQVTIQGVVHDIDVRRHRDGGWEVRLDGGETQHLRGGRVGAAEWRVETDTDGARVVGLSVQGDKAQVLIEGHPIDARVVDPRKDALALGAAGAAGDIITEMPGAIVRVLVSEGQEVRQGQAVIVVEAMKMENELRASVAGTVRKIAVAAGDRVESGALLVHIEAE